MKNIFLTLLSFLILSSSVFAQVVSEKEHFILFQLVDGSSETHTKFLKQIENVITAAPKAKIEVVTNGMGVDLLTKINNPFQYQIEALAEKGVDFVICENTLKQRQLEKEGFLNLARFVPSAILELVIKQEEGWVYIKAGS